jgi:hypothetical protein
MIGSIGVSYDIVKSLISDSVFQIQAEEDRRIFEALDAACLHSNDGLGVCTKCFLPFICGESCLMSDIMYIMDS